MSSFSVSAFILNKKNQVLLVKRSDIDTFLPGYWELPGGGVNENETPQEALKREIKEEVGLTVSINESLGANQYTLEEHGEKIPKTEMCFSCMSDSLEKINLSNEHSEYKWISKEEIDSLTPVTRYMQQVIIVAFARISV